MKKNRLMIITGMILSIGLLTCLTYIGCGGSSSSSGSSGAGGLTPSLVGTYDTPDCAAKVVISGTYAYVADWTSGLQIIDISNPAIPTLSGTYNTPGKALDVVVSGNYAYVADDNKGMAVIDISNPSAPISVGSYGLLVTCPFVCVAGNYAYLRGETIVPQMRIINISTPANPTLANSIYAGFPMDIRVSGVYAYSVCNSAVGQVMEVLNISEPLTPTVSGYCSTSGGTGSDWTTQSGVFPLGSYVYAVSDTDSHNRMFKIINVGNPAAPTLAGTYYSTGAANDVYVVGNYAYLAADSAGLKIIDVTNKASPTLAGSFNTDGSAMGVCISGNYAYVADGINGLVILTSIK